MSTPSNPLPAHDTSALTAASGGLLKRLVKAAKTYSLLKLDYQTDLRQRRDDFITWIEVLQNVIGTEEETEPLLENCPMLPEATEPTVNKVFAQLIKAYITKPVKHFLTSVDRNNGVNTISLLQKFFAPITHFDRITEMNDLNALYMFKNKLVLSSWPDFTKRSTLLLLLPSQMDPNFLDLI